MSACSSADFNLKESTFTIRFIDVGQGDAALIECDGHYMLIDGGDKSAGQAVQDVLTSEKVNELDILAISHMHADHMGGLEKALTNVSNIGMTISNCQKGSTKTFADFETYLHSCGSQIEVPEVGDVFELGRAEVEVIDVANKKENDSLVLMITYQGKKFLFTGDIEESAMTRISQKYQNESDKKYKIDLIKIPHHGAKDNDKYDQNSVNYIFLRTFMPDYFVISVGEKNEHEHPHWHTVEEIEQLIAAQDGDVEHQLFRTDEDGDITVTVKNKKIHIMTEK